MAAGALQTLFNIHPQTSYLEVGDIVIEKGFQVKKKEEILQQ